MSETSVNASWWTTAAATTAVLGNVLAAFIPVRSLLQIAPGSGVRLMQEAMFVFCISGATLLVALPLAIVALWRERHRVFAMIAVFLATTPWFLSSWAMQCFAEMRGIILNP